MWRTPTVCKEPGCRQPTVRGSPWCEKHQTSNSQIAAERAADIERNHQQPWRAWYSRWPWTGPNGLRAKTLARDPICRACNRNPSTVADHIKPHRGIWSLFVDFDGNLQGLCAPCHNEKSAKELAELGPHAVTGRSNVD